MLSNLTLGRPLIAGFTGAVLSLAVIACSDDANDVAPDTIPGAATVTVAVDLDAACNNLEDIQSDIDDLKQAAASGDRSAALSAVESAQDNMASLRQDVQGQVLRGNVAQSAADLAGAMQGLETTVRQAEQGGASALGVFQQLEGQIPAITSSIDDLDTELSCR